MKFTNDTFAPLRSLPRAPGGGRRRRRGLVDRLAGGRWSLVSGLVPSDPNPTTQAVARANLLLRPRFADHRLLFEPALRDGDRVRDRDALRDVVRKAIAEGFDPTYQDDDPG